MYNESYNDIKRSIIYPEESTELAELIGIIFGDGSMNIYKNKRRVMGVLTISGHSIDDKNYLSNYVSNLIKKLFNLTPTPKYRKNQKTMYLRLGSKGIINFLHYKGVQLGTKNKLVPPKWIKNKYEFTNAFIKGFIDTDGSLAIKKKYRKIHYYPTIGISSKDKSIIEFISNHLTKLNISHYKYLDYKNKRYEKFHKISGIDINGYTRMLLWLEKINFNNLKHLKKVNLVKREYLKKKQNTKYCGIVAQPGRALAIMGETEVSGRHLGDK